MNILLNIQRFKPNRPSQVCHIRLMLADFDKSTIELVPSKITIPEQIFMPQYEIVQSKVILEYVDEGILILSSIIFRYYSMEAI